jgi:GAF domain-containing protein
LFISRRRARVEPTPKTIEALRELARQGEVALGIELHGMASRVRAIVPELVGLSLGVVEDEVTLTLVASAEQFAGLDAVQYLDGGPCVAAVDRSEPVDADVMGLLDEGRWQLYAQASAAVGVGSSLSLPVMDGGRVVGGVNLYASTPDGFVGHHEAVAEAVGSDAAFAVANADLSFWTRKLAMEAPGRVRERGEINIALGIISEAHGVNMTVARKRLRDAAARAGISEAQAARTIRFSRGDR